MAKHENDYFALLAHSTTYASSAAAMLHKNFQNYIPEHLPQHIAEIHKIEHAADDARHDMMEKLLKEFITPIDREDIMALSSAVDDVTDSIEDVLLRMYMFNVSAVREDAVAFVEIVMKCCSALTDMMADLGNFRKSKTLRSKIIEINRMEEEGDRLYTDAMHRLYLNPQDPVEVISWTTIFDRLEKCCDKCEEVANQVESIILKNS